MRELYGDWRDVFKGFRMALDPRKITLAVGGIALSTVFVFVALLLVFVIRDEGVRRAITEYRAATLLIQMGEALEFGCATQPNFCPLVAGIIAIVTWFAWAYFAGAICRIAAVEVAKDERIELVEAAKFAREKYRSVFWSPLAVILAIVFFGLCNAAVGLLGRIPWGIGQIIVSLPLVVALFSGLLMALLLVGLILGAPLMIPTICVEGTDSFDAISRSMSYVYARPWRYLWCKLVAAVYGIPCAAFIVLFTALFVGMGIRAGAWGMGAAFGDLGKSLSGVLPGSVLGNIAAVIYAGWIYVIIASVLGYVISYILTSNTIIYMILRKAEDGTEMTEVYEEEEEDKWKPEKETPKAEEPEADSKETEPKEEKAD